MELTLSEVKPIIKYIIENNKELQKKGMSPISLNLVSSPGVGKSAICEEIARELDANYIFLSLSMLAEPSDLCGYPVRQHYACKHNSENPENDECAWIAAELIDSYVAMGWTVTDEIRMSYAIPQWMVGLDENKPTICVLDDYSRATPAILQAIMQLIYKQEYYSWKLPPNSTILLTSNSEDDGSMVTELDEAQKSRLLNFNVKFDVQDWASWAEHAGLDSRTINFMLSYSHELTDRKNNVIPPANARSYTMFANTISGIKDWEKPASLATILQIASGCFNDKDNIIGGLFTQFINRKLDKLIEPEKLLLEKWDTVKEKIKACVYNGPSDDPHNYRPEIASILGTRLLNYTDIYFSKKGAKTDPVQTRLLELIDSKEKLFSEDILFNIIKTLVSKYPSRTTKLLLNPKVRAKVI